MPTTSIFIPVRGQLVRAESQAGPDGTIILSGRYNRGAVEEIKSLEGAKWDKEASHWSVADSERNRYTFDRWKGLPDERYDKPLSSSKAQIVRELLVLFPHLRPMEHQIDLIEQTLGRDRIIGAHEMGLGKTLSALLLLSYLRGPTLIIAPVNPLRTWRAEMSKWKMAYAFYQPGDWQGPVSFKPMTPSALRAFVETVPIDHWPKNLIVDEVHNFKNPEAQQTQALMELATHARDKGGKILLLSGTAVPKDPSDVWAYAEICQPGYLRESDRGKLARRLARYETRTAKAGHTYPQFMGWNSEEVLLMNERLGNMVHVRTKKECTDLPEKIYVRREIPCDVVQLSIARTVLETARSGLDGLEKLRQLSDGFSYKNDSSFTSPKEGEVTAFFEENPQINRVVLYAGYYASIDKLIELVKKRGWDYIKLDGRGMKTSLEGRMEPLERFADKEKFSGPIAYIGHPQSGGVGLNLQASEHVVFYSNDFKGANRAQAEDRIHRIGTTTATIVDILWLPSDYRVLANLQEKRDLEGITLGEIKEWVIPERTEEEEGAWKNF